MDLAGLGVDRVRDAGEVDVARDRDFPLRVVVLVASPYLHQIERVVWVTGKMVEPARLAGVTRFLLNGARTGLGLGRRDQAGLREVRAALLVLLEVEPFPAGLEAF